MSEYIVEPNPYPTFKKDGFNVRCDDWLIQREEIVRCRDCDSASFDEFGGGWCNENCREIKAWNFCAWGKRREP